jgi:hypothetical protein
MKRNKLVAIMGWRYEPEWMVREMHHNLLPWVDDFAVLDDRGRKDLWRHEGEYRRKLRSKARKMKADWVLVTSPDERWEKNAGEVIRPLIDDNKRKVIYQFNLKEMWDPYHYRVDGIWGRKVRRRLYPLLPNQKMAYQSIQCPSFPQNEDYKVEHVDVNIYHLKMMSRENRRMRAKVFKKLDEDNKFQGIGYDYLADERGVELEAVLKDREFFPKVTQEYKFEVPEHLL